MAMMMTGRVLLVCALCVLWCGAGGGGCNDTPQALPSGSGGGKVVGTDAGRSGEAGSSVTVEGVVREEDDQTSGGGPAGSEGQEPKGSVGKPGEVENTKNVNSPAGKGTGATATPPPPVGQGPATPPEETNNLTKPTNPDVSATLGTTTGLQSAQQSQSPAGEEPTATGDGSPGPQTAAASDATRSTPAGGDAEPTSPSPGGQAAAGGPGENSAAEGTPNGTPPPAAAVTHEDNTNTTDTAISEGNSTAAGMPAPLSSAPPTKALESSVGSDACFHDTRLHAPLLLAVSALAYTTLG
ncbi:mucin-associated surface protein (MASP), putative [Trypanosoma cruzi]|uniref:Mucin-associated surface protein (MASP), putative n=1 Tax=Trypanosoma cruzi (strain CL Brener) TaxID=353153 RepID=Q4DQ70_TRYCC|nr:mucin-associated surface protein (MASP), putative [Trypanosoma cruzi]EAN94678.1 mucin-associated surface protein (MASP), putative [Trypanosoma cruzi]|eukprot:XP_816529.1 mucin-associated surface protein (MASP) [Trypanosoma cruzi strain CL Brener]